jgi:putative membrane protein
MERPANLMAKDFTKQYIISAAILLFHLVGFIGLSIPQLTPYFLMMVPWHLVLMFLLIVINHQTLDSKLVFFVVLLFSAGFIAEWIGVHTGILFGHYGYGNTLGLKMSGIPLTMGINWMLLIYCAGVMMNKTNIASPFLQVFAGGVLLVGLDLLIEPIAIRLDYWHWQNNTIPIKNYVCWFLLSATMLYGFNRFNFKAQNWVPVLLLLTQALFFAGLNLVLN